MMLEGCRRNVCFWSSRAIVDRFSDLFLNSLRNVYEFIFL